MKRAHNDGARLGPPFECEQDLHIYLLNNLYMVEPELRLYGREDLEGLQFRCAGKKLDLLTEDRYGGLLAIELKFGSGISEALGQLLGYMGAIRRMHRFAGRYLRGLIVCRNATEPLLNAAQDVACVSVYEYTQEPRIVRILEAADPIHIPEP